MSVWLRLRFKLRRGGMGVGRVRGCDYSGVMGESDR